MSLRSMTWALEDAPVTDATQIVILIALAERAHDDGTSAWPSQAHLAARARCSDRTVRRHLRDMEKVGVIRRGNQDLVAHLRPDSRPVVWDLAVESDIYDMQIARSATGQNDRPVNQSTNDRTTVSDKPSLLPTVVNRPSRGAKPSVSQPSKTKISKFQARVADDETSAGDENDAPVLGAGKKPQASVERVAKAKSDATSGRLQALRLKYGLESAGVPGEVNVAAVATRLSAKHKTGMSWDLLGTMVTTFLRNTARYTKSNDAAPWKQFLNQADVLAVDAQKVLDARDAGGTDEEYAAWQREIRARQAKEQGDAMAKKFAVSEALAGW